MPIKTAMVPVDGSDVSMKAARLAAQIAPKQGWDVVILYVCEHPPMPSFAFGEEARSNTLKALEEEGYRILAQAKSAFDGTEVPVDTRLIAGSVPETILEEVDKGCCGIIIMGSTGIGRGPLSALIFGSTAEQVLRETKVPVLLTKEETAID